MNSIPLIKGNTPQEINTSIIALKKALDNLQATNSEDLQKRIDEINAQIETLNQQLEGVDTHLNAIDGQITDLQPVDTVTSGNMHSVTSNAVFNNFINKYRQIKTINSNTGATLTLSNSGYYSCYLITISRDNVSQLAVGVVYWSYNSQIEIYWIKQPTSFSVTLTKVSKLQSNITVSISENVRISILDLNGGGLLTLS